MHLQFHSFPFWVYGLSSFQVSLSDNNFPFLLCVSSDRSSYCDDMTVYSVFTQPIDAIDVTRITLSCLNSINWCHMSRMSNVKCQMSNFDKVKSFAVAYLQSFSGHFFKNRCCCRDQHPQRVWWLSEEWENQFIKVQRPFEPFQRNMHYLLVTDLSSVKGLNLGNIWNTRNFL